MLNNIFWLTIDATASGLLTLLIFRELEPDEKVMIWIIIGILGVCILTANGYMHSLTGQELVESPW
jgi:hypothetical protein